MRTVSWGILSTAKIAIEKVIPGMQKGRFCRITGLASRDLTKAQASAALLHIPKTYGSYEALLADPDIEAVYIPLPNHLHVDWSIKALEAGKHVLCEKPIGMDAADAERLQKASGERPQLSIMEAFMYRHHPQWVKARQLAAEGQIGQLRTIQSFFSYHNLDPTNIRNKPEYGGGGLMDIGCYCISLARFLFDTEPTRIFGAVEYDPALKVDRLASGVLDFGAGTATFTCATQLTPYQRVLVFGTEGSVEIEIPFNAPTEKPCRIWHRRGSDLREISFDSCDQYTIQGDLFSEAVLKGAPVPTPLDDAVANMKAIDAVFASGRSGTWQNP